MIDPATHRYTGEMGQTYTVERLIGVPYDITMSVDIWTGNESQKQQLMEQILILFNPSIDLQTGTNPIDWSSLGIVELQDITWDNRSFPMGTEDDISIATLTFRMPIWLNPPAKMKRQNIINQIIVNINTAESGDDFSDTEGVFWSETDQRNRLIITPGNHRISVVGNTATLLTASDTILGQDSEILDWTKLLSQYGRIRPGISQIRLKTTNDIEDHATDIVGTFDVDMNTSNILHITFDLDTLHSFTLQSLTGIIDPKRNHPLNGLENVIVGSRYMILEEITGGGQAWGNFTAQANDIIEFTKKVFFVEIS
jgi:hypothetical protein